jgi:hypothetical protein
MSLFPLGYISQGGGAAAGSFELIASTIADGSSQSVTFASVPSTYKHLQLRIVANANLATRYNLVRVNGDTSNYKSHTLYGNGSTVYSDVPGAGTGAFVGGYYDVPSTTNQFGVAIVDILDYAVTTKNKTFRSLSGAQSATNIIGLHSGVFLSTAAVTSVSVTCSGGGYYTNGSRFSLYGIKG